MPDKVLVISHNCFSSFQNMGKTLGGMFCGFPKENLCQLYLYPSIPDVDICNSYFRITDLDVLKRLFDSGKGGRKICKEEISRKNLLFDDVKRERNYLIMRRFKVVTLFFRDALWKSGRWISKDLLEWVEKENPDIIFYASGEACFSYDVALYISRNFNIPMVTYVCDDYYFYNKNSISPIYWAQRFILRKRMKEVFSRSDYLIAITEKMRGKYLNILNKNILTLMTSGAIAASNEEKKREDFGICYLGNVGVNRWKVLIEIGRALRRINEKTGGHNILNIFTHEKNFNILKYFTPENGIAFRGNVSSEKVEKIMRESMLLIHVESMEKSDSDRVRYSVSSKIPDSLASGTCLFAYGPPDVASIEYLAENDAACVVTQPKKLEGALEELIVNKGLRECYVQRALALTKSNHDKDENGEKLKNLLNKVVQRA